jgi:hypothetical protein
MTRHAEFIHERYEAMLFAKNAEAARRAARELVRAVLGDESDDMPLEEGLRECCRELRPASDPREQLRFEAEFVELGIWPMAPVAGRVAA